MKHKIVVLLRGWVLVGVVEDEHEQGIVFSSSAVILEWGTTKGIGELASGPTSKTRLNMIATTTKIERKNIIFDFEVDNWDKVLS
jgi:hypothetical protein